MVGFVAEHLAVQSAFIERPLSARPAVGSLGTDSEVELRTQEAQKRVLFVDHLERGWGGSVGSGSSRAGCRHKGSADPRGSSEAGWPFRAVPRGAVGPGLIFPR